MPVGSVGASIYNYACPSKPARRGGGCSCTVAL